MGVVENAMRVKERIAAAAARAGRDASKIALLYATKYATPEQIAELLAVEKEKLVIGENYVQQAREKFAKLKELVSERDWQRIEKHMIGTLQSNKARHALEVFDAIHSVDSLKLALKLDARAQRMGKVIPVFLEVNAGLEETKRGVAFEEVDGIVARVRELSNLRLLGLMTMAPHAGPEITRPVFRKLRALCDKLGLLASMGMSNDFEVAIEEGSDLVRIGRAVFGGWLPEKTRVPR
ncbi:MAG: YggS family pyridoxal phosphate-dependent enzyme [Candidatus Micrarchaeia archaeon]